MTPQATRRLRWALLGVVVLVSAAVAWTLRRPAPVPAPAPAAVASSPAGVSFSQVVYRSFREGKESFVVKARAKVGEDQSEVHLQGVELTFPSRIRGQAGTTSVIADECSYDPNGQRASFRGHVRVTTTDGFELATESLVYRADRGRAESQGAVQFKRQGLRGSATGMIYESDQARIDLRSDVLLRVESDSGPPAEIRSARAAVSQEDKTVRFEGAVSATRGPERLKAGRLTLYLNEALSSVDRAVALDDVDLRVTGADSELPGAAGVQGARGPRQLRSRRLELWFREDGSLLGATARPNADLEILPGPGEPPERRRLKARRLEFAFDAQGKLTQLEGRIDVSFVTEPLKAVRAGPRAVSCQNVTAALDPASGAVQTITFWDAVEFSQGGRKASAQKAVYDEAKSTLFLSEGPRIRDEEEGSDLRAEAIDLGTRSGDVSARGGVRHELRRRGNGARGGLLGRDTPALVVARVFDYEAAARTGRYREDAVLRSGKDEIRAPLIVLEEPTAGRRRLTAGSGVISVLNPRADSPGKKPPAPVEIRGKEMIYEEARNQIVYKGEVTMRQGDIVTKSPEATISLTPDGARIQAVVAGEPVEVRQGERRATGTRGTYTPDTETMVLVGEKVMLQEPTRQVEGRSLTFQVGGDRVLVDGREEVRTESVFRRGTPRP